MKAKVLFVTLAALTLLAGCNRRGDELPATDKTYGMTGGPLAAGHLNNAGTSPHDGATSYHGPDETGPYTGNPHPANMPAPSPAGSNANGEVGGPVNLAK